MALLLTEQGPAALPPSQPMGAQQNCAGAYALAIYSCPPFSLKSGSSSAQHWHLYPSWIFFPPLDPKQTGGPSPQERRQSMRQRIKSFSMLPCNFPLTRASLSIRCPVLRQMSCRQLVPLLIHWGGMNCVVCVVPTHFCVQSSPQ